MGELSEKIFQPSKNSVISVAHPLSVH